MARMKADLKIHRDILFGGFSAEYSVTLGLETDSTKLLRFAEGFLKVLPQEIIKQREVQDIKGRDAGNLINRSVPPGFLPVGDEYFYLGGILKGPEPDEDEDVPAEEGETFFISLNSKFADFSGSMHIVHNSIISSGGGIPENFSLRDISEDLEADIEVMRAGIDLFESHRLSFVGFAPQVTQTFLFEAGPEMIQIKITGERLKTRNSLPLERDDLIVKINNLLVSVFDFNLITDYKSRLN